MLSSLRKLIGNIHVVEEGNLVRIEGLPTYQYINDLARIWRTSKIGLNMFTKVTSSYVTFHKFFLPEVIYTLEGALNDPKRGNSFNYRAMRKAVQELRENTWWKRTTEKFPNILDLSQLDRLNVKLFDTQMGFLETYNDVVPRFNLKGYMLGAAPGSGKTINSIAWACCLKADVTVIISPKNAIDRVWGATLGSVFKNPVSYWVSSSNEPLMPGKQFYVFHYEQLDRAVEFFKTLKMQNPVIILDESHNMNEIDSLRTQLFVELSQKSVKAHHTLWMSGTPIKAIGKEAVPLLKTIDPLFDKWAEDRFVQIFGKASSKGLDILANRLGMLVYKVEKAAVIKNIVERVEVKVRTPNGKQYTLENVAAEMRDFVAERMEYYRVNFKKYESDYEKGLRLHEHLIAHDRQKLIQYETYKRYIKMIREFYDPETMKEESKFCNRYEAKEIMAYLAQPHKDLFRNAKSVVKYYHLKVQGEALGRILGKRRMQCNLEIASHTDFEAEIDGARKKSIIFTSYVEVVDKIHDDLSLKGYKPLRVYGATNKDLVNILTTFEKDPDANPLIATFQSLSTAVPLIMASTSFMMNQPFRSGELEQTEARMDRVGQDGPIKFLTVLLDTMGDPNLSTRSADILEWSRNQVSAIMGTPIVDEISVEHAEPWFEPGFKRLAIEGFNQSDAFDVLNEVLSWEEFMPARPLDPKPVSLMW